MVSRKPICDWCREMPNGKLCAFHQAMINPHEAPGELEFIKALRVALKGPTADKTVRGVVHELTCLSSNLKDTSLSHQEARRLSIKTCERLIAELKGTETK